VRARHAPAPRLAPAPLSVRSPARVGVPSVGGKGLRTHTPPTAQRGSCLIERCTGGGVCDGSVHLLEREILGISRQTSRHAEPLISMPCQTSTSSSSCRTRHSAGSSWKREEWCDVFIDRREKNTTKSWCASAAVAGTHPITVPSAWLWAKKRSTRAPRCRQPSVCH
jgi:hypothetical protein